MIAMISIADFYKLVNSVSAYNPFAHQIDDYNSEMYARRVNDECVKQYEEVIKKYLPSDDVYLPVYFPDQCSNSGSKVGIKLKAYLESTTDYKPWSLHLEDHISALELVDLKSDYNVFAKAQKYDFQLVADKVKAALPDYQNNPDYLASKDAYMERTQSCDLTEAILHIETFIVKSVSYGILTQNLDWRTKFLAAYDLYTSLKATKSLT